MSIHDLTAPSVRLRGVPMTRQQAAWAWFASFPESGGVLAAYPFDDDADIEQTAEEARAELERDGVDVDGFLSRLQERIDALDSGAVLPACRECNSFDPCEHDAGEENQR